MDDSLEEELTWWDSHLSHRPEGQENESEQNTNGPRLTNVTSLNEQEPYLIAPSDYEQPTTAANGNSKELSDHESKTDTQGFSLPTLAPQETNYIEICPTDGGYKREEHQDGEPNAGPVSPPTNNSGEPVVDGSGRNSAVENDQEGSSINPSTEEQEPPPPRRSGRSTRQGLSGVYIDVAEDPGIQAALNISSDTVVDDLLEDPSFNPKDDQVEAEPTQGRRRGRPRGRGRGRGRGRKRGGSGGSGEPVSPERDSMPERVNERGRRGRGGGSRKRKASSGDSTPMSPESDPPNAGKRYVGNYKPFKREPQFVNLIDDEMRKRNNLLNQNSAAGQDVEKHTMDQECEVSHSLLHPLIDRGNVEATPETADDDEPSSGNSQSSKVQTDECPRIRSLTELSDGLESVPSSSTTSTNNIPTSQDQPVPSTAAMSVPTESAPSLQPSTGSEPVNSFQTQSSLENPSPAATTNGIPVMPSLPPATDSAPTLEPAAEVVTSEQAQMNANPSQTMPVLTNSFTPNMPALPGMPSNPMRPEGPMQGFSQNPRTPVQSPLKMPSTSPNMMGPQSPMRMQQSPQIQQGMPQMMPRLGSPRHNYRGRPPIPLSPRMAYMPRQPSPRMSPRIRTPRMGNPRMGNPRMANMSVSPRVPGRVNLIDLSDSEDSDPGSPHPAPRELIRTAVSLSRPEAKTKTGLSVHALHSLPLTRNQNKSVQTSYKTVYLGAQNGTSSYLHILAKVVKGMTQYQCGLCPRRFNQPLHVHQHMKDRHTNYLYLIEMNHKPQKAPKLLFCRHCNFVTHQKPAIWYHYVLWHGTTIMSIDIPPPGESSAVLTTSNADLSKASQAYMCMDCKAVELNRTRLVAHVACRHPTSPMLCGGFVRLKEVNLTRVCISGGNKQLAVGDDTLLHKTVSRDSFVCAQCSVVHYREQEILVHMMDMHSNETLLYICSYCQMRFDYMFDISAHIRNQHKNQNKFLCSVTLIRYNSRRNCYEQSRFSRRQSRNRPGSQQKRRPVIPTSSSEVVNIDDDSDDDLQVVSVTPGSGAKMRPESASKRPMHSSKGKRSLVKKLPPKPSSSGSSATVVIDDDDDDLATPLPPSPPPASASSENTSRPPSVAAGDDPSTIASPLSDALAGMRNTGTPSSAASSELPRQDTLEQTNTPQQEERTNPDDISNRLLNLDSGNIAMEPVTSGGLPMTSTLSSAPQLNLNMPDNPQPFPPSTLSSAPQLNLNIPDNPQPFPPQHATDENSLTNEGSLSSETQSQVVPPAQNSEQQLGMFDTFGPEAQQPSFRGLLGEDNELPDLYNTNPATPPMSSELAAGQNSPLTTYCEAFQSFFSGPNDTTNQNPEPPKEN